MQKESVFPFFYHFLFLIPKQRTNLEGREWSLLRCGPKIEENKNKKKNIQKEEENNQQKPQFQISIHWLGIGE